MEITIYDGNNWFRRRAETDYTGKPVSTCFYEIQNSPRFPIVVWDGFNGNAARRKIYPEYKRGRTPPGDDFFASQDLLKKVLGFSKAVQCEIPEFEADDVVAHLVERYREYADIFIESNDKDFLQLGVPMARSSIEVPSKWITFYKTMVGDTSDNIKGAVGFGDGGWNKLSERDRIQLRAIILNYINEPEDKVRAKLETVPLTKRVVNWMVEKENREQLVKYYKIVNFLGLPNEFVDEHMEQGKDRPDLAQPIFERFML